LLEWCSLRGEILLIPKTKLNNLRFLNLVDYKFVSLNISYQLRMNDCIVSPVPVTYRTLFLYIWTLLFLCKGITCTVDLNVHELQFVSDHLTVSECRKLSESLHMQHYRLEHAVSGEGEANLPCFDLLQNWNQGEGHDKTFHELALRLKEIGRKDLAQRLSRIVYDEKSMKVRISLLDDPFRDLIHKDSPILESTGTHAPSAFPLSYNARSWDSWEVLAVLGILVTCCFTALIVIGMYCPGSLPQCKTCRIMCRQCQKEYEMEVIKARQDLQGEALEPLIMQEQ